MIKPLIQIHCRECQKENTVSFKETSTSFNSTWQICEFCEQRIDTWLRVPRTLVPAEMPPSLNAVAKEAADSLNWVLNRKTREECQEIILQVMAKHFAKPDEEP